MEGSLAISGKENTVCGCFNNFRKAEKRQSAGDWYRRQAVDVQLKDFYP
jgi:hypothetical protein